MKKRLLLFFMFACVLPLRVAQADIVLPLSINQSVEYAADQGPFVINGKPSVIEQGVEVKFGPGALVKFGPGARLDVKGTLTALGQPETPITFTSSASLPAGRWGNVRFIGGQGELKNVLIENGGYSASTYLPVVQVHSGPGISLQSTIIKNNAGDGFRQDVLAQKSILENVKLVNNGTTSAHAAIRVWSGEVSLSEIETTGNQMSLVCGDITRPEYRPVVEFGGLSFSDLALGSTPSGFIYNTCALTGKNISWSTDQHVSMSGKIEGEAMLSSLNIPIHISGRSSQNLVNGSLSIQGNNKFMFSPSAGLTVRGLFKAVGEANNPVEFKSRAITPKAEDWDGLRFVGTAEGEFRNVFLGYGGLGFEGKPYKQGELYLSSQAKITADNITLGPSSKPCIYLEGGAVVKISNSNLSACQDDLSNLPVTIVVDQPDVPEEPTEPPVQTGEIPIVRRSRSPKPTKPDPVIVVPGLLGSWPLNNEAELDPIFHIYDDLLKALASNGFVEGQTLFTFPYDWRKSNAETASKLDRKIKEVLNLCGCQKVDLITHSMGGLVARHYLANAGGDSVDQLIMIGVPHKGATRAYLAVEFGDFGTNLFQKTLAAIVKTEARRKQMSVSEYIKTEFVALQELLPIYDYIRNWSPPDFYHYTPCNGTVYACNRFLENLSMPDASLVKTYNIIALDTPTVTTVTFLPAGSRDEIMLAGDGTVPGVSSALADNIVVSGKHTKLVSLSRDIVINILLGKSNATDTAPSKKVERVLVVSKFSPIDIGLRGPDGSVEFGETIIVEDPLDGQYQISPIPTGDGEYEIQVNLLSDYDNHTMTFQGHTANPVNHVFTIGQQLSTTEQTSTTQQVVSTVSAVTMPVSKSQIVHGEVLGADVVAHAQEKRTRFPVSIPLLFLFCVLLARLFFAKSVK